ncbi:MAG: sodium-dependent transporter [Phycisphaerae bacterium]
MSQLLGEQRESWGTRGGFILAAIGSAVGLGNLWGFPYKLYSFGGGAFLIPYIIALFVIGIPLMILEFSLGHYTQRAAPEAFRHGNRAFEMVGWWGILLGFVIITYYPVILAYCFSFLGYSIQGIFNGGQLPWAGEGIEGVANAKNFFFSDYLGYKEGLALGSIRWNIVFPLVIAWACMYFCIFRGVKLVGKIVWWTVPLPWLMLLILTVRGLTLPGSIQGLGYYLDTDFSQLARPIVWRYAFGQVFFSMSLAFGVMLTYASFLHRKSDLNNNAAIIGLADFATSFVAGLAVFATLGAMAFATQQEGIPVPIEQVAGDGPSLAFIAFPYALAQLPYSAWFSFVFFFALVTLGIDSAFSITESILASIVDKTGWRRDVVLPMMSLIGLLLGLIYVTAGGLNWLSVIDGFVNGTWGIAFLGLLECVILGWLWRIDTLRRHANSRSDWQLGKWWDYLIRIVIPIVLGTLFFWQLFDDVNAGQGLLRNARGQWNIGNCVGMLIVVVITPMISLAFTIYRSPNKSDSDSNEKNISAYAGRSLGFAALACSMAAAVLLGLNLFLSLNANLLGIVSVVLAAAALLAAGFAVDKYNTAVSQASWSARWAGVIAAMVISLFIAAKLFALTAGLAAQQTEPMIHEGLSGISYIILAVVFLLIIGGLGWCFYKALIAAGQSAEPQSPDEIGDEKISVD